MSTIAKLFLIPAILIALGAGLAVAASGGDGGTTTLSTTTGGTTTAPTGTEDVSGPCDEAEHANDPRCTGTQGQDDNDNANDNDDGAVEPGEDVSGPCDEAEHANDPRCTGTGAGSDDRSGPGKGSDDGGRRQLRPGLGELRPRLRRRRRLERPRRRRRLERP